MAFTQGHLWLYVWDENWEERLTINTITQGSYCLLNPFALTFCNLVSLRQRAWMLLYQWES